MNPAIKAYLDERGLNPSEVQIKERLHIEKINMEGPEPVVVERVVVENGKLVEHEHLGGHHAADQSRT